MSEEDGKIKYRNALCLVVKFNLAISRLHVVGELLAAEPLGKYFIFIGKIAEAYTYLYLCKYMTAMKTAGGVCAFIYFYCFVRFARRKIPR